MIITITLPLRKRQSRQPGNKPSSARAKLAPSNLRPHVKAPDRAQHWIPLKTGTSSALDHPVLRELEQKALFHSLKDNKAVGSALRKYHIWADLFNIPERERFPASFQLIYSFGIWAVSTRSDVQQDFVFEPVTKKTAMNYLDAINNYHTMHHLPRPMGEEQRKRIEFALKGIARLSPNRRRPPRPPVKLSHLHALRQAFDISDQFDAACYAAALSAFFGLARLGELTVPSVTSFDSKIHATVNDLVFGSDQAGRNYAKINLPAAKTDDPNSTEMQSLYLTCQQNTLNPLEALRNHRRINAAPDNASLFAYRTSDGNFRPLTKSAFLNRLQSVWEAAGIVGLFGHSFRIGGASFFLAKGVSVEMVRLLGRWRSIAFELYLRAFEEIAPQHLQNVAA